MPPSRITKLLPKPVPKVRDGMSESHLAMVRKLPCCVCGSLAVIQAHHLLRTGEHGTGRKSSDRWAIPLCRPHHDMLHHRGDEEQFLMDYGVPGRELASALWAARNKPIPLAAMERVASNFRMEAAVKMRTA
jgi:hypothetical protein